MIYSVGSIFLDHIIKINSFPKKPIKVLAQGIEKRLGGSAAVASFTIKKLGLESSFIGRLGDDDVSRYLKGELRAFKIKQTYICAYISLWTFWKSSWRRCWRFIHLGKNRPCWPYIEWVSLTLSFILNEVSPRFYGRRKGRKISRAGILALKEGAKFIIEDEFFFDTFFTDKKKIILEIGFGDGKNLIYSAKKNP